MRCVELNPVKARLCERAQDWAWSSAGYHIDDRADGLTDPVAYPARIPDWRRYLDDQLAPGEEARLGYFTQSGYPMGAEAWVSGLEVKMSSALRPAARGHPRKDRQ